MTDFLSREDFAHMVRVAPLIAIDLIIRDPQERSLVGLRTNAPARGTYFVPGGIIRKGETLDDAFARILGVETGLDMPRSAARLLGVYQHFYPDNRFGDPGYGTHYVVIGYEVKLDRPPVIQTDDQHSELLWLSPAELLAHPKVHENAKAYFR